MRWIRSKLVVYISLFLVSLCFGSFIVNQKNNVSAVDSISVQFTKDEWFNYSGDIFPECDDSCLSYYSYLQIEWLDIAYNNRYNSTPINLISYTDGNYYELFSSRPFGINIYNFNYVSGRIFQKRLNYATSDNYSIKFTLMDSLLPSGSISITENGEYDVSSYATAVVEVPNTETIIQGDYHDDLIKIYNAIIICAGVALVIYFFYCIYRMIIKTTGGY